MQKKINWEIEFNKFIDNKKNKPFRWGSWDCCKFSNGIIKAMTGENLIPKSLSWKNKETAMKSIKEYGGTLNKSITKACKDKNLTKINKNFITKGDLVVFKEESELVGVCDGYAILGPTDDGIRVKPLSEVNILNVWRIA